MFASWVVCLFAVSLSVSFFVASFSLRTMASSDPGGPALFPRVVIAITLFATAITIGRLLKATNFRAATDTVLEFFGLALGEEGEQVRNARRVTFVIALSALYPWIMLKVGFVLSTAAFIAILMGMFRQVALVTAAMSIGVSVAIHYLFSDILSVRVIPGEWFDLMRFFGL